MSRLWQYTVESILQTNTLTIVVVEDCDKSCLQLTGALVCTAICRKASAPSCKIHSLVIRVSYWCTEGPMFES